MTHKQTTQTATVHNKTKEPKPKIKKLNKRSKKNKPTANA